MHDVHMHTPLTTVVRKLKTNTRAIHTYIGEKLKPRERPKTPWPDDQPTFPSFVRFVNLVVIESYSVTTRATTAAPTD